MYCFVETKINGERTKCVLLATYRREIEQIIQRKCILGKKVKFCREKRSRCLLFVPHQHTIKEIVEIDENELLFPIPSKPPEFIQLQRFTSRFLLEEPYFCEYEIKDFSGYEFIARDTSFIGNAIDGCSDACLEVLYGYDKALATLKKE